MKEKIGENKYLLLSCILLVSSLLFIIAIFLMTQTIDKLDTQVKECESSINNCTDLELGGNNGTLEEATLPEELKKTIDIITSDRLARVADNNTNFENYWKQEYFSKDTISKFYKYYSIMDYKLVSSTKMTREEALALNNGELDDGQYEKEGNYLLYDKEEIDSLYQKMWNDEPPVFESLNECPSYKYIESTGKYYSYVLCDSFRENLHIIKNIYDYKEDNVIEVYIRLGLSAAYNCNGDRCEYYQISPNISKPENYYTSYTDPAIDIEHADLFVKYRLIFTINDGKYVFEHAERI